MATRKRCPNGSRKDKKSGECVEHGKSPKQRVKRVKSVKSAKRDSAPKKRCPEGSRKNKQGVCQKYVPRARNLDFTTVKVTSSERVRRNELMKRQVEAAEKTIAQLQHQKQLFSGRDPQWNITNRLKTMKEAVRAWMERYDEDGNDDARTALEKNNNLDKILAQTIIYPWTPSQLQSHLNEWMLENAGPFQNLKK
jgi:hypothetical protein